MQEARKYEPHVRTGRETCKNTYEQQLRSAVLFRGEYVPHQKEQDSCLDNNSEARSSDESVHERYGSGGGHDLRRILSHAEHSVTVRQKALVKPIFCGRFAP